MYFMLLLRLHFESVVIKFISLNLSCSIELMNFVRVVATQKLSAQGDVLVLVPAYGLVEMLRLEVRPVGFDYVEIRVHRLYWKKA